MVCLELRDALDPQRLARRDREKVVGHGTDWDQVALRVIGQLVVHQRVDGDHAAEREQQRVIVVRGDETRDRRNAVRALAVLHHHRLAPARRQSLGEQPCRDVGAGAWRQRHDDPHGALRPDLRPRRRREQSASRRLADRQAMWPMLRMDPHVSRRRRRPAPQGLDRAGYGLACLKYFKSGGGWFLRNGISLPRRSGSRSAPRW